MYLKSLLFIFLQLRSTKSSTEREREREKLFPFDRLSRLNKKVFTKFLNNNTDTLDFKTIFNKYLYNRDLISVWLSL